jgi:hypothetical protein
MNSMFEINLPKWSAMFVSGKPVTVAQAGLILLLTDDWRLPGRNKEWVREFTEITDVDLTSSSSLSELRDELRILKLRYLINSRINSSWVGGVYGWCDWDGTIGCSNFNIGKDPSVEVVFEEWKLIAEAFPFLELTCQLYSGEVFEFGVRPLVEYVINEGGVLLREPTEPSSLPSLLHAQPYYCDFGYFQKAWNQVVGNM